MRLGVHPGRRPHTEATCVRACVLAVDWQVDGRDGVQFEGSRLRVEISRGGGPPGRYDDRGPPVCERGRAGACAGECCVREGGGARGRDACRVAHLGRLKEGGAHTRAHINRRAHTPIRAHTRQYARAHTAPGLRRPPGPTARAAAQPAPVGAPSHRLGLAGVGVVAGPQGLLPRRRRCHLH